MTELVTTIKGGTEFDAPWLVIHAGSADETRDIIGQVEASGLLADVGRASSMLQASYRLGKQAGATPVAAPQTPAQGFPHPQPTPAPQQAPQGSWSEQGTQQGYAPQQPQQQWGGQQQNGANPADNKQCIHGPMTFRPAGISRRTNQPYSAFWACGSNVKGCKPIN